jgi:hypothetical protein
MNELTTLLESLASKLGTTTEYLWGVMIKQAPIDAFVGITLIIISFLLIIPYVRYIKWFAKNYQKCYDNDTEVGHWIAIVILAIILCIWLIISICDINNVVTALANPEYWALEQILNKI